MQRIDLFFQTLDFATNLDNRVETTFKLVKPSVEVKDFIAEPSQASKDDGCKQNFKSLLWCYLHTRPTVGSCYVGGISSSLAHPGLRKSADLGHSIAVDWHRTRSSRRVSPRW